MPKHTPETESNQAPHQPVLGEAVLDMLTPRPGERYLDLTAGYGGHARTILERTGYQPDHVLVDRDEEAVSYLTRQFAAEDVQITHSDYETALAGFHSEDVFDLICLDLGVSSPQLDSAERGFSFSADGPLDMRMDQTKGITAAELLDRLSESDIADILARYGEERQSGRIARAIARARPIERTTQLSEIVADAYKGKPRLHPATRTFQALRIAVNDEIGQLERSLPMIESVLSSGGRLAVISFHSLEDRTVKQFITGSSLEPLHSEVIQGKISDVSNPRARSAKLRAAIKNTNGPTGAQPGRKTNTQRR